MGFQPLPLPSFSRFVRVSSLLLLLGAACVKINQEEPGNAAGEGENVTDVPKGWNPTPEEIAAAPETLQFQVDDYTVRFLPGPSRAMLEKKPEVYRLGFRFFKGGEDERGAAQMCLVELGLPTARFFMELPGILVPKSERTAPDPDAVEFPETPEDRALQVVKEIQAKTIKRGDVNALMAFFAAATGKVIDLDIQLAGRSRSFRNRPVHPIPALWSIGKELGCDMNVLDPNGPRVQLQLPVALDLKVHGEDLAWLLRSMADQGRFRAVLDPSVKGAASFRIRASTFAEAFRLIAEKGGFSVRKIEGGFQVGPKED